MSNKTNALKAKGLDVGTSRLVLARTVENTYQYEGQSNAFISLPYSRMTKDMLRRERILFSVEGSTILAYGNRVEEFANILNGETRRPIRTGLLNPAEPKSLQMLELALTNMCGEAQKGEKICFSVPCGLVNNQSDVTYHERTIAQILEKLDYCVKSLNEGLAVIYAELESTSFTGIGISFGGGMCNVCLAYLGLPVVTFSTPQAGDYVDYSASSVTGETPTTVRLHKEEQFQLNGFSGNNVEQAITVYYNDMIRAVVMGLEKALSDRRKLPKFDKPVPVAISGGSAQVMGFRQHLEKEIRAAELPIAVAEVSLAEDPLNTTAKGTLMAAMLDM